MRLFAASYGPPMGELYAVKARGEESAWEVFKVTSGGLRNMGTA